MADPFSIIAGAIGVADVAVKVVGFIKETKKGTGSVDGDLQGLVTEIESLKQTSQVIKDAFKKDMEEGKTTQDNPVAGTWSLASTALADCNTALVGMGDALTKMKGENGSSTLDRLMRHRRRLAHDEEFGLLRQSLDKGHHRLQTSLLALGILVTRQSNDGLSAQIAGQEQLIRSLGGSEAQNVRTPELVNEYFMTPQSVSNLFVGRKLELLQLKQVRSEREPAQSTMRVVIYGINGSGKTEFCYKFAQDNRSSFWGIFFINATNAETVRSSYVEIAERVGIAAKENNVKYWLSAQTKPWLLLVDNADGSLLVDTSNGNSEGLALARFVPESQYGTVLFTTTSQSLSPLCHVAIKLEGIGEDVSDVLLFTSAARPQPVTLTTSRIAKDICQKFGSLPLAITRAGAAISNGVCTLKNCLEMFERSLTKVRKMARDKAEPSGTTPSQFVCATFEMLIPEASKEALQLLKLLSFMQSQRFHPQILVKAVLNPQRQNSADKKLKKAGSASSFKLPSWNRMPREIVRAVYGFLQRQGELPAFPHILRSLRDADPEEVQDKLREIFAHLRDLSLIDRNEEDGTYGMHSSISWWIRASMPFKEKQVWCQAACNVLASAILLPPVGAEDDDVQLRRRCLPHIQHVRDQQHQLEKLGKELEKKQKERERPWLNTSPTLDKARLLRDAKFSMAYAESGMFRESQDLMKVVDDYLSKTVGLEDPVAVRVRLFLAETHWWLGNPGDARRLQKELFDACAKGLGEEHVDTLRASEKLGSSYWQLGKYDDGRKFAEKAVNGYRKIYVSGHVDKSQALTTLGRCYGKLADFDRAVELHEEALTSLKLAEQEADTKYGDQIMFVKENLAMARYDRHRYNFSGKDDLRKAEILQDEVFMNHREKLGKEHPKTLWAMCNLARIKAATGKLEEAEQMIKTGLPVAARTIGIDHVGTLMGKTYLGQILIEAEKLGEAELLLFEVVGTYRTRDGEEMHGDHLVAASFLLGCYRQLKKYQEAEIMEKQVLGGIRHIFGDDSPWEQFFVGRYMVRTGAEKSKGSL